MTGVIKIPPRMVSFFFLPFDMVSLFFFRFTSARTLIEKTGSWERFFKLIPRQRRLIPVTTLVRRRRRRRLLNTAIIHAASLGTDTSTAANENERTQGAVLRAPSVTGAECLHSRCSRRLFIRAPLGWCPLSATSSHW